jgi:hypothetical protein
LRAQSRQWASAKFAFNDACVAIFAGVSTRQPGRPILFLATVDDRSAGTEEVWKMRRLRALLRKTPSRIGRRIAEIVAIAAASLPAAGA